jgi:hypothetical protein
MKRAVISLIVIAAVATACSSQPRVDWDEVLPDGGCVVLRFLTPDGAEREMAVVDCTEPHTHIVLARVSTPEPCPPGTDVEEYLPGSEHDTWCLGAVDDPSPSAEALGLGSHR